MTPCVAMLIMNMNHIDIYITDGRKHLIIENKIWAGDQPNQLQRYVKNIQDKSADKGSTTEKKYSCNVSIFG